METTTSNVLLVVEKLQELSGLPGFPRETKALTARARSVCRIARNLPRSEWLQVSPEYAAILGDAQTDLDWLIQQLVDVLEFFPQPIVIRAIYERCFSPADGRSSASMTQGLPERNGGGS